MKEVYADAESVEVLFTTAKDNLKLDFFRGNISKSIEKSLTNAGVEADYKVIYEAENPK